MPREAKLFDLTKGSPVKALSRVVSARETQSARRLTGSKPEHPGHGPRNEEQTHSDR